MTDLLAIREQIDRIDSQMVTLFEERMKLCQDVAEYKISTGKNVLDKQREMEKIKALRTLANSDFNEHGVEELFTQIMSISRKLQYGLLAEHGILPKIEFKETDELPMKDVTVVFQGVPGSYSNAAMLQYFGEAVSNFYVPSFDKAMKAVAEGRADYAVLPLENSSAGQVGDVYDLLVRYENTIIGECYLKISHALLGLPGASISDITTVYSHPQGLMQCAGYLNKKGWKQIGQANTAASAKKLVEEQDITHAAIASEMASKLYGLAVLEHPVNDNCANTTRFIIVSSKKIFKKDAKKVSICFEIAHESGTLYNALSNIIYNNLNMTKIESRPIPDQPFEYRFFVDFEGNLSDPAVSNALLGIREEVRVCKILGNY